MCGLVGVAGDVAGKEEKIFRQLLFISSLRGMDSTGAGFIPRGEHIEPIVSKGIGGPWNLVSHKSFKKGMTLNNMAIIGHNRYATIGKVNRVNAHPFENRSVVGVHNGTLNNQTLLPDSENFSVDSENIFHSIDINGEKDTIKNLHGAFALVWWDKAQRRLKVIRNSKRNLFYTYNKQRTVLYWASELEMLDFVLTRENVSRDKIFIFNVQKLYSFEFPTKFPKRIVTTQEDVEFYVPPVATYGEEWRDMWGNYWPSKTKVYKDGKEIKKETNFRDSPILPHSARIGKVRYKGQRDPKGEYSLNKKMRKLIAKGKLPKHVKGPGIDMFNQEEFEAYISKDGACCWCSVTPIYGDDIRYLTYPSYLCSECKDDPEVMPYANAI